MPPLQEVLRDDETKQMKTRRQPSAPTPPCKRVSGRAHPAVPGWEGQGRYTEARPMSFSDSGSTMTSTLSVSLSSNRRFLPHRLYPASPNTLLYLKLSQDKNRGRLSSWRKHPRKTSPHGSERQRLNPQWDTLLYTTTTTTIAGEDHRGGMTRATKSEVLDCHGDHIHEGTEAMVTCMSPGWAKIPAQMGEVCSSPPPHSLLGATSVW